MLRLVGRRLLNAIPLLLIVSFAVFVLVDLAPGDVAVNVAGEGATPERIAEVRRELGLDDPLVERYGRWAGNAVQGDLGTSLTTNENVWSMIADRLSITFSLILVSMVIATGVALVAGIGAALKPRGMVDRLVSIGSSLAVAAPPFWIGLILVLLFAVERSWFPAVGYAPLSEGLWEWLRHLILPGIALAGVPAAELARQLRGSLVDVMDRDYVLTARAKGLTRASIVGKHALKNAAIPVITVLGFRLAQLFGGTVVVERVFNIQGIGSLAVNAVLERDIPVVLGITVFTTVVVILVNVLVDASYGYFNPKVRTA